MSRRTTILVDPDLLERVERLARLERTTKTAVITAALEEHLREHERRPDLPFVAVGRSDHGRLSVDSRALARRQAGRAPSRP